MTREEFIAHEVYIWGEDYIFNLIESGYSLIQVSGDSKGWKWVLPANTSTADKDDTTALDNGPSLCYASGVGAR